MRNGSSVSVWFQCSEEAQAIINAEDVIDIGIEIASTCKLTLNICTVCAHEILSNITSTKLV